MILLPEEHIQFSFSLNDHGKNTLYASFMDITISKTLTSEVSSFDSDVEESKTILWRRMSEILSRLSSYASMLSTPVPAFDWVESPFKVNDFVESERFGYGKITRIDYSWSDPIKVLFFSSNDRNSDSEIGFLPDGSYEQFGKIVPYYSIKKVSLQNDSCFEFELGDEVYYEPLGFGYVYGVYRGNNPITYPIIVVFEEKILSFSASGHTNYYCKADHRTLHKCCLIDNKKSYVKNTECFL